MWQMRKIVTVYSVTSNEKYVTIVKMVAHIMRKSAILNLRVNPDVKVDIIVEKDEAK